MAGAAQLDRERCEIRVAGVVQGVGFRPYVHALATRLDLAGHVQNRVRDVLIVLEGPPPVIGEFLATLGQSPPPLAVIRSITHARSAPRGEQVLRSLACEDGLGAQAGESEIPPDVATCAACLGELADPHDRRHDHPFINCTDCGPRLTIVTALPYDRVRTTMAGFPMCERCHAEFGDPGDRRFHAQPVACPACGPRLALHDERGQVVAGAAPIQAAAALLQDGAVVAIKGLGGYHLACLADREDAVMRLRSRKQRDDKPFAVMVRDADAAARLCVIDAERAALMASPARPVVLCPRREPCPVADAVAPDSPFLGLLLPYTPVHHLLCAEVAGPLVMTSGNRSDEPMAQGEPEVFERLAGIADAFLVHDRPIATRCDDSVVDVVAGAPLFLRRARGHAPVAHGLPVALAGPVLAVGAQLDATFALGQGASATLSPYIGDLDDYQAYRAFTALIDRFEHMLDVRPALLVHDLHPDLASTRYALERAARTGMPTLAVQHHHAHMAACMAEHGLVEPVIGVTFDGLGYGNDGTLWGGEFLVGDAGSARRAAHLLPVAMPGGVAAIREPWRMAAGHLAAAGIPARDSPLARTVPADLLARVERLALSGQHAPVTSSVGRLFDAVAALASVADRVTFKAQAAMRLESLALSAEPELGYPYILVERTGSIVIDTRPLIAAVVEDALAGVAPARIARRFHSALADIVCAVCEALRDATGIDRVVASGGVFCNRILTGEFLSRLSGAGFQPYRHQRVPPGDGGLALGQIVVAAAQSMPDQANDRASGAPARQVPWKGA